MFLRSGKRSGSDVSSESIEVEKSDENSNNFKNVGNEVFVADPNLSTFETVVETTSNEDEKKNKDLQMEIEGAKAQEPNLKMQESIQKEVFQWQKSRFFAQKKKPNFSVRKRRFIVPKSEVQESSIKIQKPLFQEPLIQLEETQRQLQAPKRQFQAPKRQLQELQSQFQEPSFEARKTLRCADNRGFNFTLHAPKSLSEHRAHLIRDKIYKLNLGFKFPFNSTFKINPSLVTSIISIQFEGSGQNESERVKASKKAWELWASRNPNEDIEILRIGTVINAKDIENYALNAYKVKWIPLFQTPEIEIGLKGFSLGFCNPISPDGCDLQIQIDSYLEHNNPPKFIHTSICPIKVVISLQEAENRILYAPSMDFIQRKEIPEPIFFKTRFVKDLIYQEPLELTINPAILTLFLKQASEETFTPLVCCPGNLLGFALAFSRKFAVEPNDIRSLYKSLIEKGRKSWIVVDDAFFAGFANQAFNMDVILVQLNEGQKVYDVLLSDWK